MIVEELADIRRTRCVPAQVGTGYLVKGRSDSEREWVEYTHDKIDLAWPQIVEGDVGTRRGRLDMFQ